MPVTLLSLHEPIASLCAEVAAGRVPSHDDHTVSALLTAWESLDALPRPAKVEADLDLFTAVRKAHKPVPFINLPLATQLWLGGARLVADWYAPMSVRLGAGPTPLARAIVTSEWTVERWTIADLAAVLVTPYARHHYWPSADTPLSAAYAELVEAPAVFRHGKVSAPVVFLDGRPHGECVAYALALVRFCPLEAIVSVVRGTLTPARFLDIPLPTPAHSLLQWSASGLRALPKGLDDPDASFEDRTRIREWAAVCQARERVPDILSMTWALERLDGVRADSESVHEHLSRTHDRLVAHAPPYAGATIGARAPEAAVSWVSPIPFGELAAWRPPVMNYRLKQVPKLAGLVDALRDELSGAGRRRRRVVPAQRRLAVESILARYEQSSLPAFVPELHTQLQELRHEMMVFDRTGISHAEAVDRVRQFRAWSQVQDASLRASLDLTAQ